ncbi:MAG: hypothetical protein LAT82_03775 [Nanoarchaeota archaeon]|nr:hypothetical protein [Nanoarchaeota archaeon]
MRKSNLMKEVSILIKKNDLETLTHTLYDLQLIEFFESKFKELNLLNRESIDRESEELVLLRSAITRIKPYFTSFEGGFSKNAIDEIFKTLQQKEEIEQKIIQAKDFKLRELVRKNLYLNDRTITSGFIGYIDINKENLIKSLKDENKAVKSFTFQERVYFYSPIKPEFKFKEYFIPKDTLKRESVKELQKELDFILDKLKSLANSNLRHLQSQELKLAKEVEIEQSKEQFKASNHHIVIQGFVPKDKIHFLEIGLQKELADSYHLEIEDAKYDEAPVQLPNKGIVKAFEELLSFYSFPKYREFDPSIIMVLFFPLFFGFILGDFGYGLVTFLIFSLLKSKFPDMKNIFSVMQLSSISSMFFGVLYGEYFGFEPHLFAFEFHRANYPETLLLIALIFGLIHINLGFLIGILNHIKYSMKKVFCDYISWMILQVGVGLIYLGSTMSNDLLFYLGFGCIGITIILLYIGHGFQGVIEIPTLFTNVLSYARLMAVGLSSIAIAVLVNEFSVPLIQGGIVSAIFGIILITTGHLFNIALGNFESFLQSLRLHYVEFFSKFYEGGGREFKPFGLKHNQED